MFGIFLSIFCCGVIGAGLFLNTRTALGKNPEAIDRILFMVAPYGLAVCVYYYIFFLRGVEMATVLSGSNSMGVIADILINVLLPAALLTLLFISFQMIKHVGWRIFSITVLTFFIIAWLHIIWLSIEYSRNYSAAVRPGFPIVQWSIAVFVALIVVTFTERKRLIEQKHQQKAEPVTE